MRRFEFVEGKSSKFWEVAITGCDLELRWGRIGTSGQSKTRSFGDETAARKECDKLVREKTGKGYVEVTPEAVAEQAPVAAAAPVAKPQPVATVAPANEDSGDERVVWTHSTRKQVLPSRSEAPIPYEVDLEEAWQSIGEIYEPKRITGLISGKARVGPVGRKVADGIAAFFDGGSVDDPEVGAGLLQACTYWGYSNSGPVLRWLAAARGFVFATECCLRALDLSRSGTGNDYLVFTRDEAVQFLRPWEVERLPHDVAHCLIAAFLELRRAAAAAPEDDYREAVSAVRGRWSALDAPSRLLAAMAFPSEGWWRDVEEIKAPWGEPYYIQYSTWILTAPDDVAATRKLAAKVPADFVTEEIALTIVDRLGVAACDVFEVLLSRGCQAWAGALEVLEARGAHRLIAGMGDGGLPYVELLERRPALAAEALAPIAADPRSALQGSARLYLAKVVRTAPDVVEAARLTGPAAEALRAIAQIVGTVATPGELPGFLASPPWNRKRAAQKSFVATLEPRTYPPIAHMTADERREATRPGHFANDKPDEALAKELIRKASQRSGAWWTQRFIDIAYIRDPAVARRVWETVEPDYWYFDSYWSTQAALSMVANYGADAADLFVTVGERARPLTCAAVQTIEDPRLAPLIAESFSRLKSAKQDAGRWLERYPRAAAYGLIPAAVGKTRRPRDYAEAALRHVASAGHEAQILAVAQEYGPAVREGIAQMLATDPMDRLPSKIPKLPAWWAAPALPRLVVTQTGHVLDDEMTDAVGVALALSSLDDVYPGVPAIAELCTPASLEAFAIAVFRTWLMFGASSKEYWALYVLGWFGGDEAARTLAPLVRKWPGESAAKRAQTGLDVLATIGTDVSLMHVYAISQKVKYASIKKRATELVDELASELGLSHDELGDRLVPDFDLAADGSTTIDYGPRTFRVRFDESLKPIVFDESGKRLKSLPKPGKGDAEMAGEEQKRFKGLSKDVRAVATQQIERLERAMCSRRRWTTGDFRQFFVEHPLVVNLARRLVWGAYGGDAVRATFRVDDDGTLVGMDEERFELGAAKAGIPHPLELADELQTWGEIFADYELMQPFPQLAREVREPSPAAVDAVIGATLPAPKLVYGLERYGWRRGEVIDGGAFYSHHKDLGDVEAYVEYSGAVGMGYIEDTEPLKLEVVQFRLHGKEIELGGVDPVAFSEALTDLARVTGV